MRSLVFGGRSPIALATCAALTKTGSEVTLVTRQRDDAIELAAHESGATLAVADLTAPEGCLSLLHDVLSTGRTDGAEGSDSLVFLHRYRGRPDDLLQHQVEVLTPARLIVAAAEASANRPLSVVVAVSPASRTVVTDQPFAYHASKAAQVQLVRYYAATLGSRQVRVNGVSPTAFVFKERAREFYAAHPEVVQRIEAMVPLGRMATPADVAGVVAFLASPASGYISGEVIEVDGGLSALDLGTWGRDRT